MSYPQPGTLVEVCYRDTWCNGRVFGQEKPERITVAFVKEADVLAVKHFAMNSPHIRLQPEVRKSSTVMEKGESQRATSDYVRWGRSRPNASMGTITSELGNKDSLRHAPAQHLDNPLGENVKRPSASRQSSGTQLGKCTTEQKKLFMERLLEATAPEYVEPAAAAREYSEVSEVLRPSSQKDVPNSRRSREVEENSDTEEEHDPEYLYWNEMTCQLDRMGPREHVYRQKQKAHAQKFGLTWPVLA